MAACIDRVEPPMFDSSACDLPTLIGSIGEDGFERHLISYLNGLCGAEHLCAFQLGSEQPRQFASVSFDGTDAACRQANLYFGQDFWRRDPTLQQAQRSIGEPRTSLLRLNVRELKDRQLRDLIYGPTHIRDRLLLYGMPGGMPLGLSILRSELAGAFEPPQIESLQAMGSTLLSLIAKNAGVRLHRARFATALTSLAEIEGCIRSGPQQFPPREAEVSARILYGMTTLGIALDLDIGEETVMTYRKRAYQRLGIASHRELLLWYLSQWSARTPSGTPAVIRHSRFPAVVEQSPAP